MKVKRLSDDLHQRVLGYLPTPTSTRRQAEADHNHKSFDLADAVDRNQVVNIPLPKWAKDFKTTAEEAISLYGRKPLNRLQRFSTMELPALPKKRPQRFRGWLRCAFGESDWEVSETPASDTCMVLDFETVEVAGQWMPVCCAAMTDDAWYVWQAGLESLKPTVAFSNEQVVIGHNVGYDRSFLASEYPLADSGNRFFDTMAAFIAVRGFTNQQRSVYAQAEKDEDFLAPAWVHETATNGLDSVYELYTGRQLDKGTRDGIVKVGLPFVRDNFSDVLWYCIKDVRATFEVFSHVYPELRRAQPSDLSMTGQLLLGNTWLPLSADRWNGYYDKAETEAEKVKAMVEERLIEVAKSVLNNPTEAQLNSPVLDWTPAKAGKAKGLPKWYRDCKGRPSINSRMAAVLLGCTWRGETVLWDDSKGWYTNGYGALPHPEKRGQKLTNLFMQKMVQHVESGLLDAPGGLQDLLKALMSTINWTSLKKRAAATKVDYSNGYPVTLPRLVVTGTVTRRCKDDTWQVASNPKATRIGTELKSMIEAPPGYSFVGADVDSEELWLAAALGDAASGVSGLTPLGLMVLIGTKADKTDVHSVVAAQLGISRDLAKNLIYGLCYGLGFKGAADYIAKANPLTPMDEVKKTADNLIKLFKGVKSGMTGRWVGGLASEAFNEMEAIANSKHPSTPVLKASISKALSGIRDFATTRVNWTIQSSGVD